MGFDKETGSYNGFIYIIKNNINSKVYIGQTSISIEHRWKQHLRNSNKESKYNLYRAMNKYDKNNFYIEELEMLCLEDDVELSKQLDIKEKYYIEYYNSIAPNGYNLTPGGKDCVGGISLMKQVDAYYLDGTFSRTYSSIKEAELHIKGSNGSRISKCCDGKTQSSLKRIWRWHGEPLNKYEIKENLVNDTRGYANKVKQFSLDGKLLNTFDSQADAMKSLNVKKYDRGYVSTSITKCCDGNLRTAYGYVWRYIDDDFNAHPIENQKKRKIKQYDLNGNLLNVYNSFVEASKAVEVKDNTICTCCSGDCISAGGYIWRYYEDDFNKYRTDNRNVLKDTINIYDMNNNYIISFDYFSDIQEYFKNIGIEIRYGGMNQCCIHRTKHHRHYKFFYASDPNNPDKSKIIPNLNTTSTTTKEAS